MRKKLAFFVSILIIISIFFTACGSKNEGKEDDKPTAQNPSPTPISTNEPQKSQSPTEPISEPEPFHIAPASFGDVSIAAVSTGANKTVALDSAFLIRPSVETTREELGKYLSLNSSENIPETFSLDENGAEGYLLTPESPLVGDSVYTLRYESPGKNPLSFAFQTEPGFRVESTSPGASSYGVPVDTGIEVTFSSELDDYDGNGFSDSFIIQPSVRGRWNYSGAGNTYIYVPTALQYSTSYTVTVKGGENGVRDTAGRKLEEDYTFSFTTEWSDEDSAYLSVFGSEYETFLPDDEVFVELNVSRELADAEYSVEICRADSPQDFLNGQVGGGGNRVVESFTTKLSVTDTGYQQRYYLPTGKTLEEGYYVVFIGTVVNGRDYYCEKYIQVSSLSVYALAMGGKMAVWVNDTSVGREAVGREAEWKPCEGAKVRLERLAPSGLSSNSLAASGLASNSLTANGLASNSLTNSEGVAILDALDGGGAAVFVSVPGSPDHVYNIRTYGEKELEIKQKYYNYLYTDRAVYFPNDTIRVFGVINARYEEDLLTEDDELSIKLGDMEETAVKPDKYGAFDAAFKVSDMFGGTDLTLTLNGETVCERRINFAEYERAKYNFTAETDKKVYLLGETVTVNASVSTLDGSPVEGMTVASGYPEFSAVTDANGNAAAEYEASAYDYDGLYSWQPDASYGYVTLLGRDDDNQETSINTIVLPSTVMLEYEQPSEGVVEFTSSLIDRDALEEYLRYSEEDYYSTYGLEDIFRGEAHDMSITLEIMKETTVQTNKREYYNFIQKKNVTAYDYETVEEIYSTSQIETAGGKAVFTGMPVSDDAMVRYYAEVSFTDTKGNSVGFTVYSGVQYGSRGQDKMYSIKLASRPETPDSDDFYELRLNETGIVSLYDVYAPETEVITGGRLLLIPATDVITRAYTGTPDATEFKFTENYINSASLFGAYFDGRYVYPTQYPVAVGYDTDGVNLDVSIDFDKEVYKPGDTVNADVTVKDADGRPAEARVNLSVVDEAVLKANPNEAMFLNGYFSVMSRDPYPFSTYASFTPHDGYANFGGAEMGDGGGIYMMRQNFDDNPAFLIAETDAGGKDSVTFKLSDAVTSWRVTALAITEDGKLGDSKKNIPAVLPFYIDLVMLKTFLTGDELAVYVKPFGDEYKFNGTNVKYTAELIRDGDVVETLTDESALAVTLNFGKRPAGDYTVRVYADAGGLTDAIEEPVSVVETDTLLPLTERHVLDASNPKLETDYDISGQPVSVVLTNGDMEPLIDILYSGVDYSADRTDYMAAAAFADGFWDGKRAVSLGADADLASALQNMSGVAELTYGEADLLYTARFAAAFPELVSKENITGFVNLQMSNEDGLSLLRSEPGTADFEVKRASAYFALAAVRENVLTDLYYQMKLLEDGAAYEIEDGTAYESKLRILLYASACAAIGDDASAKYLMDMYEKTAPAEFEGAEKETLSTLIVYVKTVTDPPAAFEMLKQRLSAPNVYVSDVCEKINFLKKAVPVTGVVSEVSYSLNGKMKIAQLRNFECLRLSLTIEQYKALNVKYLSGRTNVEVNFAGGAGNLNGSLNSIKVSKTITQSDAAGSDNIYLITVTVEDGDMFSQPFAYTVCDRVPSNMRAFDLPSEEQVLTLWAGREDEPAGKFSVSYYAEKVSDSEAVIPAAYASRSFNLDEAWGASE